MTRTRKLVAAMLLVAVVSVSVLTAALATDTTETYAYLPDHSVYFYDVTEQYAWAHREVDTLAVAGVIKGSGNHLFYPERAITRADFIVMLDRAFGMSEALDSGLIDASGTFVDVPGNTYYSKSVTAAKAFGVATGTDDNRFLPVAEHDSTGCHGVSQAHAGPDAADTAGRNFVWAIRISTRFPAMPAMRSAHWSMPE